MFEVLAFVYENYWGGDACPELLALQRKLNAVGFDDQEVADALLWLEELKSAVRLLHPLNGTTTPPETRQNRQEHNPCAQLTPSLSAMRVFTPLEQQHLGVAGWGFITFMASIGALPSDRLELVMERAMAAPGDPVSMDDLKLIVLMVFWSLGEEPDALVLDELCDCRDSRLAS
jgi:Smg protein